MKRMRMPSPMVLLLNGGAALVAAGSLAAVIRSALFAEAVLPCKERYTSATRLSLDRNGVALATGDLQGQLANSDWGLLKGGRVVKLKSGPAKYALQLDLGTAPSVVRGTRAEEQPAGIGFSWAPQSFKQPQAACLAYSVYVPEGFAFGQGGRLPGLVGRSSSPAVDDASAFSTRYTWGPQGDADIFAHMPDWPEGRSLGVTSSSGFKLQPGKWTELEQEILLNTPGRNDGVLRVWQDGKLVLKRTDLVFRTTASVQLRGVLAQAAAGELPAGTKRGSQKIWLTPFELRWE
ncbi:MAG: polysaccharide lyase [Hyphomicrobiaceae bacterium]